jgi:hypothetical protein
MENIVAIIFLGLIIIFLIYLIWLDTSIKGMKKSIKIEKLRIKKLNYKIIQIKKIQELKEEKIKNKQ